MKTSFTNSSYAVFTFFYLFANYMKALLASKKYLALVLVYILSTQVIMAQFSAQSGSAKNISTTSVSGGTNWTNPSNVQAFDDVFATVQIGGSSKSTFELNVQNWGFQSTDRTASNFIPVGAKVHGIEVSVKYKKSLNGSISDNKVRLLKNGVEVGENKARTTLWSNTASAYTYGNNVDTWGDSFTATDLTNTNFGVRISAKTKGGRSAQAEIDHISITVYFNAVFFYSRGTGNLEDPATWGLNTDGNGTAPSSFTDPGQIFFLTNRTSATLTDNLTISGTNSALVVGDNITPTTLIVPSNFVLNATVEVRNNSSLIISNTTGPKLGYIGSGTTVTYNAAGDQMIGNSNFFNLTLGGSGTKSFSANTYNTTIVSGALTIGAGVTANNQGNNIFIEGTSNGIVNNGLALGTGRYIYSLEDVSTTISGNGSYRNLEIDAATSNSTTRTITLNGATTVTGTLTLSNGTLANGSNLTMGSGSLISFTDGGLANTPAGSAYDIAYGAISTTSRTTGAELNGSVRNVTVGMTSATSLVLSSNLRTTGNLLINSGTLDPSTSNFGLTIGGNFTNNGIITARNNTVTLNAGNLQSINGTAAQAFHNLVINSAAGGSVQLNTPVTVNNLLTLTNGIVTTSATNPLTIASAGSVSGGNNNSFINGPMRHIIASSTGTRTFPVGKGSVYRPVTITVSHSNNASVTYTAEMFSGAPATRKLPADLASVSAVRYHRITNGNSTNFTGGRVTIAYGTDDNVSIPEELRIAKSNGSDWMNIGGTGSSAGTGTIQSDMFYGFSDFVLAENMSKMSPLPLSWLSFHAEKKQNMVELKWKTADEVNTDGFVIEKSADGQNWKSIGTLNSRNQPLNNYSFADNAPEAHNYYRIKQLDNDGTFTYTKVIYVAWKSVNEPAITVYPNPVTGSSLQIALTEQELLNEREVLVKIMDTTGKIVHTSKAVPAQAMTVQFGSLKPGMYTLFVQKGYTTRQAKIVVQ